MSAGELLLRKMLWLRHGCHLSALYGDDGKMDCNACLIDFAKDSPENIERRLWELAQLRAQSIDPETLLKNLKDRIANSPSNKSAT